MFPASGALKHTGILISVFQVIGLETAPRGIVVLYSL